MPCDTIQTSSVDLAAAGFEPALLAAAVKAALGVAGDLTATEVYGEVPGVGSVGLRYDVRRRRLQVSGSANAGDVGAWARRVYVEALVKRDAARFGWRVSATAPGRFVLQR